MFDHTIILRKHTLFLVFNNLKFTLKHLKRSYMFDNTIILRKHTLFLVFNNLKFTLKHLKRSYMFRSYDHHQEAYFVPS